MDTTSCNVRGQKSDLKDSVGRVRNAVCGKPIDARDDAAQCLVWGVSPVSAEFGFRPCANKRKADDNIWITGIMHFGLYLVIGTTVLMTVELSYAIYQIARMYL